MDLNLRNVSESDLPIFFQQQEEPEANLMAALPARHRAAFDAHWKTRILNHKGVEVRTILIDGEVAGNILCWEQAGKRMVSYWIGKAYWGKGIATKALSTFLDQIKSRPLYAHAAKHNVASAKVLEKCGFKISRHGMIFSRAHEKEIEETIFVCE